MIPKPTQPQAATMKDCMGTYIYGENTGKGYTGAPISKCHLCHARRACDKVNWIELGGKQ
jgi:hypothetical protein